MKKIVPALLALAFFGNMAVFAADTNSSTAAAPTASSSTNTATEAGSKSAKHCHKKHTKRQTCSKASKK